MKKMIGVGAALIGALGIAFAVCTIDCTDAPQPTNMIDLEERAAPELSPANGYVHNDDGSYSFDPDRQLQ